MPVFCSSDPTTLLLQNLVKEVHRFSPMAGKFSCVPDLLCRATFQTKFTGMASAPFTHMLYGHGARCLQLPHLVGETSDVGRLRRGKHLHIKRRKNYQNRYKPNKQVSSGVVPGGLVLFGSKNTM